MIYDDVETIAPAARSALQAERLAVLVDRLRAHPFHGPRLPPGPVSLADLPALPTTSKQDLWDHYPLGLLAVGRERLARVHATSGTKGRPTFAGYTRADLRVFAEVTARGLAAVGAGPGTVVHNAYGYGLFTGGLGLHGGAELLGCAVVPASGGQTARQVTLIADLRPDILCCTPSYAALLGEHLAAAGLSPADISLRAGIFGAEPWTAELRVRIEELLGIVAVDIYGLTEVIGPGVSFECPESRAERLGGGPGGSHVNEDHFLVETLDPVSAEPVAPGAVGELTFTTLTKEALPLIRFRTGDLATLTREQCACGRTTVRMSRVLGRRDDMLVIRGVNVYPSEVEAVVLDTSELAPHYVLVVDRTGSLAELAVLAELAGPGPDPEVVAGRLAHRVRQRLALSARVAVGPPGALPRAEVGKAVRVLHRAPGRDDVPEPLRELLARAADG